MNSNSIVKNKNIFLALFLSVFTITYLFKVGGDPFILSDFCLPPDQTEIELLLPDYPDSNLEIEFFNYSSKQLIHFISSGIISFENNDKALFYFNNCLNHQFKTLNCNFDPTCSFISILRKTLPSHQFPDDDPLLLS